MSSDKCENAYLKAQLKSTEQGYLYRRYELSEKLDETEKELTTARTLLADILPLAMGASCRYSDHPEADIGQHCCDWSPVVDRICKALGRELPEADLGTWYKRRHHENTDPNELQRLNMERNVAINAVSEAYLEGVTDWEQIAAIAQEHIAKLHQDRCWLELGGEP